MQDSIGEGVAIIRLVSAPGAAGPLSVAMDDDESNDNALRLVWTSMHASRTRM